MADIPSHHFIYGTCQDFITGETIVDTDDERYRQDIARFLVKEKGYKKADLTPRLKIETLFSGNFVVSTIDLTVSLDKKRFFILRYAPGSLVTRERSACAAARVLQDEYQIPYAVVTNGRELEYIEVQSGKILATGFGAIPNRQEGLKQCQGYCFAPPLSGKQRERELRILNSYDIEICCIGGPCALPNAPEG